MKIISLLSVETVLPSLKVNSKEQALEKLIATFSDTVDNDELEAIRQAVLEREKIMSTGVGKGLAIPHGKAEGINGNYAAFALLEEPIDYEAIDGEPVHMIFLLAGPQASNRLHIKLLSRISRLMNNNSFRDKLKESTTSEEIISAFKDEEEAHFGS